MAEELLGFGIDLSGDGDGLTDFERELLALMDQEAQRQEQAETVNPAKARPLERLARREAGQNATMQDQKPHPLNRLLPEFRAHSGEKFSQYTANYDPKLVLKHMILTVATPIRGRMTHHTQRPKNVA